MSIDAHGRTRSRLSLIALTILAVAWSGVPSGVSGQERGPDGASPPWQDPPARTEPAQPDTAREGTREETRDEARPARRTLEAAVTPAEPKSRRAGRGRAQRERQAQAARERRRARVAEAAQRADAMRRADASSSRRTRSARLSPARLYRGAIASDYAEKSFIPAPAYRDPLAQMRREGWGTLLAGSRAEHAAQAQRRGYIVLRARTFHGPFGAVYRDTRPYDPGDDPID